MRRLLRLLFCLVLVAPTTKGAVTFSDDFDDGSINLAKWPVYYSWYGGQFLENAGHLEHAFSGEPVPPDHHPEAYLESIPVGNRTTGFSVEVEVSGTTTLVEVGKNSWNCVRAYFTTWTIDNGTNVEARIVANVLLTSNSWNVGSQAFTTVPSQHGRFKFEFKSDPGVFSVFYTSNLLGGDSWVLLKSFGIDGEGGLSGNTSWSMSPTDSFTVGLRAMGPPGGYFDNVKVYLTDTDNDGVPDERDACPGTAPGEAVDANGCSIAQLVPSEWPWKNHGQYVAALVQVASRFFEEGRITQRQMKQIIAAAAESNVSKRR